MPSTTSRLALQYPLTTDSPNGASQIQTLADELDVIVTAYTSGTAASRPSTPTTGAGTLYLATDTGALTFYQGSAWITLGQVIYTAGQGIAISSGVVSLSGSESVNVVSASGSTLTLPAPGTSVGNDVTLSANCTITMPTVGRGSFCYCIVRQAASGGPYTATFTGVKWPGGSAPTVSAGASAVDMFQFVSDASYWRGVIAGQAFA